MNNLKFINAHISSKFKINIHVLKYEYEKKIVYSHNNKKVQSLQFIFYHNYRHVLYENKTASFHKICIHPVTYLPNKHGFMFHDDHIFPQSLNQTLTKNEETEVS